MDDVEQKYWTVIAVRRSRGDIDFDMCVRIRVLAVTFAGACDKVRNTAGFKYAILTQGD